MLAYDLENFRITAVNLAAIRRWAYSEDEFLSLSMLDIRPAGEHQAFLSHVSIPDYTLAQNLIFTYVTKDGREFQAEAAVRAFESQGRWFNLVTLNDVTSRLEAERQLKDERAKREKLLDVSPDMLFEFEESGSLIAVSSSAEKITGFTRPELLKKSIWDLLAPQSRFRARRQWLLAPERQIELEVLTSTGRYTVLEVCCSRQTEAGKTRVYFGVGRDITARVQAEKFERQRRKILEMVTSGVPLSGSLGMICKAVEEQLPGDICVILPPPMQGARTFGCSPENSPCPAQLGRLISATRPGNQLRVLARHHETGIVLQQMGRKPGEALMGRTFCWILPVQLPSGEQGKIFVLRKESGAPDKVQSLMLEAAADLLRMVLEHERLHAGIRQRARLDALTGLPNRLVFAEQLNCAIDRAGADARQLAVFYMDLDDFKLCNDSAGHLAGDHLLQLVASRMQDWLGRSVLIARMGGDEFTVLIRDVSSEEAVERVVQQLIQAFERPFRLDDGREFFTMASVGVSLFPRDGRSAESLLRAADAALYHAKPHGPGSWMFYTKEMEASLNRRFSIQSQLGRAIDRGELSVVYQPQLSLRSESILGVEALLRWNSPSLGEVSPVDFIPIAEHCGLIIEIGKWVLRTACRQASEWRQSLGSKCPRVAVNVSCLQFRQTNFVDLVAQAIEDAEIPPELLELELTESVVVNEAAQSQNTLERLRSMGVRIALDDFGTGYSSLSYLERLPVNPLKLDQSFIRRISPTEPHPALVDGLIRLAHSLGIEVIAEGVETNYQSEMLRSLGCDHLQGYLISRPVPADLIPGLIDREEASPSCFEAA
jgi:diguanylate cyclase (GGDEF)-like protein/PAS domain S-box-containing protein